MSEGVSIEICLSRLFPILIHSNRTAQHILYFLSHIHAISILVEKSILAMLKDVIYTPDIRTDYWQSKEHCSQKRL